MLFADNICKIHTHRCAHTTTMISCQLTPWHPIPALFPLFRDPTLLFTYLEILLLLLVVRIPIHSCPWFAINCSPLAALPTPRHPIDQVTYLQRQHQQHQPSHLTQVEKIWRNYCRCLVRQKTAQILKKNKVSSTHCHQMCRVIFLVLTKGVIVPDRRCQSLRVVLVRRW